MSKIHTQFEFPPSPLETRLKKIEKSIVDAVDDLLAKIKMIENWDYQLIQAHVINANEFKFNEYDPNAWYKIIVCYNTANFKIQTTLELPAGLDPEYLISQVARDYYATSSNNVVFDLKTKKLMVKNWNQEPIKIDKVIVYKKEFYDVEA